MVNPPAEFLKTLGAMKFMSLTRVFCFMLAKLSCDVNSSIFSSFITARTVVFSFVAAE